MRIKTAGLTSDVSLGCHGDWGLTIGVSASTGKIQHHGTALGSDTEVTRAFSYGVYDETTTLSVETGATVERLITTLLPYGKTRKCMARP